MLRFYTFIRIIILLKPERLEKRMIQMFVVPTTSRVYKKYDKENIPKELLKKKIIERSHYISSGQAAYSISIDVANKLYINKIKELAEKMNCVFFNEYKAVDKKLDSIKKNDCCIGLSVSLIIDEATQKQEKLIEKKGTWPPVMITFNREEEDKTKFFYLIDRTNYNSREDKKTVKKINKVAKNICDILYNGAEN